MNPIFMKITDKRQFGDIVLADIIFTDWTWSKLRPVLILYNNWNDYTILKMSSQNISWDCLKIPVDDFNNLRIDSWVDLAKISTYHETLFHKKLGIIQESQKNIIKSYRSSLVQSW